MTVADVVMLEFNELTLRLMNRFIDEGELPNFARLKAESVVAVTDPEEPQERLNPWVQWVTVHTGVPVDLHGAHRLGDGAVVSYPTIADVVDDAGHPTWVCGSMNLPVGNRRLGVTLPDPWHPDGRGRPAELDAFNDLVRTMVQEHSNPAATVNARMVARFCAFMLRRGLSVTTVRSAVDELLTERRTGRGNWGRAIVLDRLQWDVFWAYRRRVRPRLSTFFSNSTAHFQHVFWRDMEPDLFETRSDRATEAGLEDAVLSGYRAMDCLVADVLDRADSGTAIVFCTALGQQPYIRGDSLGDKRGYRARDIARLVEKLELTDFGQVSPVMSEQFALECASAVHAERAVEVLRGPLLGGKPLLASNRRDLRVVFGCGRFDEVDLDDVIEWETGTPSRFGDLFYRMDDAKSGYHHPDGMLWMRVPGVRAREIAQPVSLRAIAPTILSLLGVEPADSMDHEPLDLWPAGNR